MVKNPPAEAGDRRRASLIEDPLEEGTATRSSILAWRIPGTERPRGLQSTGSQELDMTDQPNNNSIINKGEPVTIWRNINVPQVFLQQDRQMAS